MQNKIYKGYYISPIGIIKITSKNNKIIGIDFIEDIFVEDKNEIIEECKIQLEEYFNNKRTKFDLDIEFEFGTEFQKKVWYELSNIPYGEVVSYKYIAEAIDNPKAVRAVGGANNKNPIAIIVPCHRVIGANGKMVGYGWGIDVKKYLIDLEKN